MSENRIPHTRLAGGENPGGRPVLPLPERRSLGWKVWQVLKTVQARLGHASAAETLDTYTHLWPDDDDRTRDAVDTVLGTVADQVRTSRRPLG